MPTSVSDVLDRFTNKVDPHGPLPEFDPLLGACWVWTGAIYSATGYGSFVATTAHRWAYVNLVGPIPDGLHIDHLCRVRSCCNPDHLEPVTQAENNRRQAAAQTHCLHGHEYTAANTYLDGKGYRRCRVCVRESSDRNSAVRSARRATARAAKEGTPP
jgi:hypothetical protein